MISQFFINRPKSAFVLSILITLGGLISVITLPVNMFPEVTPPVVQISAFYPGASAEVVEETVIRPIEEQVNGVENMLYIDSSAANNGSATISVIFAIGTDDDIAQVNVQNRVAIAESSLPEEVVRAGVTVKKKSTSMLLGINLTSPDGRFDQYFLNNYANNFLLEPLARINGVASAEVMGNMNYSMRLWLDPTRMTALNITVQDINNAVKEQNMVVPAGKLGQSPNLPDQQFEYSIQTQGRLVAPEEFGDIILRARADGSYVRINDVARIERGSELYDAQATLNNSPTAFMVIYQLPDANATAVGNAVRAKIAELSQQFPTGLEYEVLYDTTRFIDASIQEVKITLYQAVILVILVVFAFLQNFRATLIPAIAIPVSLVGTFMFMSLLGFTINTITLFGLVLAIGIVVDDAIVVIENVERLMVEKNLSAKEATRQAMQEVAGPVVATTLVLLAVFVPVGFMPGMTGELYKQFSVTISVAVIISSLNALTLSPALCVTLLNKNAIRKMAVLKPIEWALEKTTAGYSKVVGQLLRKTLFMGLLFIAVIIGTGGMAAKTPTGFIPEEDQGFLFLDLQLPDAASLNRTQQVLENINSQILSVPGTQNFVSVAGFSMLAGAGSNRAMGIVILDDWQQRTDRSLSINAIQQQLQSILWSLPDAQAMVFNVPAIPGLGASGGFDFRLQDTENRHPTEFAKVLMGLIYEANQRPELQRVFSTFRANVPQYYLDIERNKAKGMGIPLSEIFLTLQAQLGSLYINDYNQFGRTYKVIMQADIPYRAQPEHLRYFYLRNGEGDMVPLSTLAKLTPILGPTSISHYNLYRSAAVQGEAKQGFSSGDAIQAMEQIASRLPTGYTFEWSGQSRQEIEAGNLAPVLFGLAIIFVYLFLVAQYESWTIPFAVLGAVPLALFGAFGGLSLLGLENNLYAQVGLILLIGLSTKTAILIVEFAMQERRNGKGIMEAAHSAANLRFRAVLMTALSFVLGVLPLVFSSGAGASSRVSLGVTVLFGMLAATVLTPLLVPFFYRCVQTIRERFKGSAAV